MDVADVKKLKVPELRKELEQRGLDSNGLKQALIERLEEALAAESGTVPHASPVAASTAAASTAAVPPSSSEATVPAVLGTSSHTRIEFKPSSSGAQAQPSELEKKAARLARFGSATLAGPEKGASNGGAGSKPTEKPKSGILSATATMDDEAKAKELEARKARAKRFNLPVNSIEEEQEKKKARAERFGAAAQGSTGAKSLPGAIVNKPVVSEEEAAKRQARAQRFGTVESQAVGSGTTAEQLKKLEDRKIRFGAGNVAPGAASNGLGVGPPAAQA
ncbi:hypothetical protein WJX73_001078 [Symbiochloris irregularis]|uniref:SAP domain-containing protein n=1 Tax=Symbiochloris irregularis TaxID=706552 RepID=A0AAW1P510_9CHLO